MAPPPIDPERDAADDGAAPGKRTRGGEEGAAKREEGGAAAKREEEARSAAPADPQFPELPGEGEETARAGEEGAADDDSAPEAAGGLDSEAELDAPASSSARRPKKQTTRAIVREIYYGDEPISVRFRFGFLLFDLVTIAFFVTTTVMDASRAWLPVNLAIGIILLADFLIRLWISTRPRYFLTRLSTLGDFIVLVAIFGSVFVSDLAFLRILRMLRIFRSYHLAREFKERSAWYRRHEDVIVSATNLFVFIFITTSLVVVVEEANNPDINNYLDALYFTLATLTTTGFGDIVVTGTAGRLLAVIIMVLGVALFLRLIQTIFRPTKVHYRCPTCGLNRHDPDAVHCKHCGTLVNIPTKGEL